MKQTNEIADPTWEHIYDRDAEITRLEAELLALGDQLTDSDCQLVDALAENERLIKLADAISRDCNDTANKRNELQAENNRLTKALEQITRLSPRTMAVSEAQHIAGKALKGSKQ